MKKKPPSSLPKALLADFKALVKARKALRRAARPTGALPVRPTATVWVSRDTDGRPVPVPVATMSDMHVVRWIRYFRRRYRSEGVTGTDAQIDALIKGEIVTAPAIYGEAKKRGLMNHAPPAPAPASAQCPVCRAPLHTTDGTRFQCLSGHVVTLRFLRALEGDAPPQPAPLGTRRITLDEENP